MKNKNKPTKTRLQRFMEKIDYTSSPDGCWLWTASKVPEGYGHFWGSAEKLSYAHRYAAEHIGGMNVKNKIVRHQCHNKSCVNPVHLKVGTAQDNIKDSLEAGHYTGSTQRLTRKETAAILKAADGKERNQDVAERFGITPRYLRYLKNRKAA